MKWPIGTIAVLVAILLFLLLIFGLDTSPPPPPQPDTATRSLKPRPESRVRAPPRATDSALTLPQPQTPDPAVSQASLPQAPRKLSVLVQHRGTPQHGCTFLAALPVGTTLDLDSVSFTPGVYDVSVPPELTFPLDVLVRAPPARATRWSAQDTRELQHATFPDGAILSGFVRLSTGEHARDGIVTIAGMIAPIASDGSYEVVGVPVGEYAFAYITTGSRTTQVAAPLTIERDGDLRRLDFILARARRECEILVSDNDGRPVIGAEVRIRSMDHGPDTSAVVATGADGRALIGEIREGAYLVFVRANAMEPRYIEWVWLPNDHALHVTLIDAVDHWLTGRVVRVDGTPVAGAEVTWAAPSSGGQTITDRAGRFRFEKMIDVGPNGQVCVAQVYRVQLQAWARGLLPSRMTVGPDRDVTIVLAPSATLKLTVVDPSGFPLPAMQLFFRDAAGSTYGQESPADIAGASRRTITWTRAPRLRGQLTVRLADGRAYEVSIDPVTNRDLAFEIEAHRMGRIRLLLTPPVDQGATAMIAWCRDARVADAAWCDPRRDWTTSECVPVGRSRFLAVVDGFVAADLGTVEVRAGATTDVRANLVRHAELTVSVRRRQRAAVGAMVVADADVPDPVDLRTIAHVYPTGAVYRFGEELTRLQREVGKDGVARFRYLRPGATRVTIVVATGERTTRVVDLTPGDNGLLDVELED